ncbi:MAG: ATP/GTP-binding protein [Candidatus Microbacterium colombiense]|nr:MAG: ATP/GTP-binding protein [Microbacterium sp.]
MTKVLEQQIAVFGESGSGKTVLLSSFFGPTEEEGFGERNLFEVVADDAGQGATLFQNFLGMRNSARVPDPNKFRSTSYSFSIRKAKGLPASAGPGATFDAVRLVWHDYPGEWFEQDVAGEEADRRVEVFRTLLGSDVAVLLVDAQRLIDNEGQEEAYLKALFYNYRVGIENLRERILDDGKPLTVFPRIWIVALSKSDLLPDTDVHRFKELVIEKSAGDLNRFRATIASMVDAPSALAVGEDFLLLSSAKFSPGHIELTQRVGVDLMLPIAAVLPLERHVQWINSKKLPHAVAEKLLENAGIITTALIAVAPFLLKVRLPGPLALLAPLLTRALSKDALEKFVDLGRAKLEEVRKQALKHHDYLTAVLTRFRIDLEDAEKNKTLLRSLK